MTKPKKLIEVAMPVKEISAESVRDKSIRHGHISTLHLWWARRPLPVCRAVVFASLVPDPLDENCPKAFKDAVQILLGRKKSISTNDKEVAIDPYKPYDDIPHTVIVDKMEDNLRNRLMMFIGKFSDRYVADEKAGKKTPAKYQLSDYSLIKWDNKNNKDIIGRARKLIFVQHNAADGRSAKDLLKEYQKLDQAINEAEENLYTYPDRHIDSPKVQALEKAKDDAIAAFLAKMPKVFDPFAGGGAIPLEAARLGCNSYGNDINPVAHIIQKGSCEFPQKYGKPISYSVEEFEMKYGKKELEIQKIENRTIGNRIEVENQLAFDIQYYANKIISDLQINITKIYPENTGKDLLAVIWTKEARCPNPSCNTIVPIVSNRVLCNRKNINIDFEKKNDRLIIKLVDEIVNYPTGPTIKSSKLSCPVCKSISDNKYLKTQSFEGHFIDIPIAVVKHNGKEKYYEEYDYEIDNITILKELELNAKYLPKGNQTIMSDLVRGRGWNYNSWTDLFSSRQLLILTEYSKQVNLLLDELNVNPDYKLCLRVYLSLLQGKLIDYYSKFCRWAGNREEIKNVYSRQAIAMIFDSAETFPFSNMMGSIQNHLSWITRYIKSESISSISSNIINSSSGDENQFNSSELDAVVTDPPYYNSIAYADISDYFYVWHKENLQESFPINFSMPQTPKSEECTALKHHRNHNMKEATSHFEGKLAEIFEAINHQVNPEGVVSIMFAHQSTAAWTTLCNSVLNSGMNLTGSWALDSEYSFTGLKQNKSFLASSVTVSAKTTIKSGYGSYKDVQKEILSVISKEVTDLYSLGFRGADLLTACFGKAVSVFGKYKSVEKSNGDQVTVAELLAMARQAAFDAIISDIDTDDSTKFYIGWLNLFSFSTTSHDDVQRITQIGLSVDIGDIYGQNILLKEGDKGTLGSMMGRINEDNKLGLRSKNTAIDIAHRLMFLYDPSKGNRGELLDYILEHAASTESPIWRVLNSLVELLPRKDLPDFDLASGLLSNQESLIRASKNKDKDKGVQSALDLK